MEQTIDKAYMEVLEALKYIPIKEFKLIPKEKIAYMERHKNINYIYKYNPQNPNLSKKAHSIIIKLYMDYIATETEKIRITEILKLNEIKSNELKNKNVNKFVIQNNTKLIALFVGAHNRKNK